MIITFRPEFTPPWVGRPHVTLLTLSRLPPRQRAEMIGHVTGGKALPKEVAEQIINRTDGVPLFIEELTKSVVESGLVTEAGDRYAAVGPVTALAIPTSLHASLLARLDRVAPTREVAQIAAALGRSFSHELISAVAQMPQQKLDDALEQLVVAELIFAAGCRPTPNIPSSTRSFRSRYSTCAHPQTANPRAHRHDFGEPIPRDGRRAAAGSSPTLRRSGSRGEGDRILAQGGPASSRPVGDTRGRRAVP